MIDFTLSEEHQALRELARDFTKQEIEPIVKEREKIPDPVARFPWDIVEKASKVGLRSLGTPKKYGGAEADTIGACVVNEEMAVGDIAIATVFDQTCRLARFLFYFCNADQVRRFLEPFVADDRALIAIGATEPNSGSDTMLPYDEPGAGIQAFAEHRNGGYVLNGRKQFISLGSDASIYIILARTDRVKRYTEGALTGFLLRRGAPGFTIGPIWDKIGQRLINNADLIFDNCLVPEEDVLIGEGQFYPALQKFMRGGNAKAAALAIGPGRAAYEAALSWAEQRVQGGKPIIEHQAIAMMLADMATKIETARLLYLKAAWAADYQEPFDFRLPGMAKTYASEAAFDICRLAMEIHGGYGIMKDLPLEKWLRDASTMLHSDGTNQIHRLRTTIFTRRRMVGVQ